MIRFEKEGTTLTIVDEIEEVESWIEMVEMRLGQIRLAMKEYNPGHPYPELTPGEAVKVLKEAEAILTCIRPPV